jgi:very-short-patch-repair endonuclease
LPKERYKDLLDYRLKQLDKSKKAQREASSFYIVTSNNNGKMYKYYSFDKIPIEIRHDEENFEILKIRYEILKPSAQKSRMTAPRMVWRTGYSFYEKLIHINLIKRGYKEHQDFEHLYKIGDAYVIDFAFPNEKLVVECDGEPWHEKCRVPGENEKMDLFFKNNGWKVLRVNFNIKDIQGSLINALKLIDLEIKTIRNHF